jgi:hypothetical protein
MFTAIQLTKSAAERAGTHDLELLEFLNSLYVGGILIVARPVTDKVLAAIQNWPDDKRKTYAVRLLQQLTIRGAIKELEFSSSDIRCNCGAGTDDLVDFAVRGCGGCSLPRSVELSEWAIEKHNLLRQPVIEIKEGDPISTLRSRVLRPLVRHSESLRVIDRYLASDLEDKGRLSNDQRAGLKSICDEIVASKTCRSLHLVSGIANSSHNTVIPETERLRYYAQKLLSELTQIIGSVSAEKMDLNVDIHSGEGWDDLHERRLATNVGEVVVDSGVNWIKSSTSTCHRRTFTSRPPTNFRIRGKSIRASSVRDQNVTESS